MWNNFLFFKWKEGKKILKMLGILPVLVILISHDCIHGNKLQNLKFLKKLIPTTCELKKIRLFSHRGNNTLFVLSRLILLVIIRLHWKYQNKEHVEAAIRGVL